MSSTGWPRLRGRHLRHGVQLTVVAGRPRGGVGRGAPPVAPGRRWESEEFDGSCWHRTLVGLSTHRPARRRHRRRGQLRAGGVLPAQRASTPGSRCSTSAPARRLEEAYRFGEHVAPLLSPGWPQAVCDHRGSQAVYRPTHSPTRRTRASTAKERLHGDRHLLAYSHPRGQGRAPSPAHPGRLDPDTARAASPRDGVVECPTTSAISTTWRTSLGRRRSLASTGPSSRRFPTPRTRGSSRRRWRERPRPSAS